MAIGSGNTEDIIFQDKKGAKMRKGTDFEISKDVYDRAQKNRGYLAEEDKVKLFSESIRWGYGLYHCMAYEKDGKYYCSYETGDSCD